MDVCIDYANQFLCRRRRSGWKEGLHLLCVSVSGTVEGWLVYAIVLSGPVWPARRLGSVWIDFSRARIGKVLLSWVGWY